VNVVKLAEEVKYELWETGVIPKEERGKARESEKAWEARFDWVNAEKDKGNALFKDGRYEEAIDQYLRAYSGIAGFSEKQKPDDQESINVDLKGPILNNIAMCLIKQGKLPRALFYLDLITTGEQDPSKP
jgi:tetratricopeptide (TPR) repeat protein